MRDGAEYFTAPASAAQRRYEALRAYFLDEMPAAEVADRFGYSTASVHQMATLAAQGQAEPVRRDQARPERPAQGHRASCAPGCWSCAPPGIRSPRSPPRCTAEGMPVSAQTVWQILDAEGLPRLPRRDEGRRGPPARLDPVKAAALPGWPAGPAVAAVRSRRAAAPAARHRRGRPAGPGQPGGLPLHPGAVIVAVDRHAAAGQVRPQAPRLPRRDAGRRRRAGVHPRADRPAQDHPPGHLLLAGPPRLQPRSC